MPGFTLLPRTEINIINPDELNNFCYRKVSTLSEEKSNSNYESN